MDKLITKEADFVFEPTYSKIAKIVNQITKELIQLIGPQYSNIIKERINNTNFVFFNKITDLKEYCDTNKDNIKKLNNKKIDTKYDIIEKGIVNYENKKSRLIKKLKLNFILEIQDELSADDQAYIRNHKKIDLENLSANSIFFNDEDDNLINGIFMYFSDEYEDKLKNKSTSISEMEEIFNNREKCLKSFGLQNVNVKSFARNSFDNLFDIINKYNNLYKEELDNLNLDKKKIVDDFLINDKFLTKIKNKKVLEYFTDLLKNNNSEVSKINDKIIDKIIDMKRPEIIWACDNYSDENNMRFLLFSPTMDFKNNDFLFVQQICRLAFNSEFYNNKSVVQDNTIIGKDNYLMFSNIVIDYIASQITKKMWADDMAIINHTKQEETDINDDLFLVEKFYEKYNITIIDALINNDKNYLYEKIGKSNFENYVNIINRYYYDHHGNLLPVKERKKAVFTETIKNILEISLQNMEQYQKILINKDKYPS